MSGYNYCFLTCIQVSQEAGQVVWYSHLFQNFAQFLVIHTVKGFCIVNKTEIDVLFWNSLAGMDEFNSDDHYIYYCGQVSLRRNGVAILVNKRVQNAVLGCSLKNDRMICLFPKQTIQYHSNPSLCPNQ